jgi:hypothetical protein
MKISVTNIAIFNLDVVLILPPIAFDNLDNDLCRINRLEDISLRISVKARSTEVLVSLVPHLVRIQHALAIPLLAPCSLGALVVQWAPEQVEAAENTLGIGRCHCL